MNIHFSISCGFWKTVRMLMSPHLFSLSVSLPQFRNSDQFLKSFKWKRTFCLFVLIYKGLKFQNYSNVYTVHCVHFFLCLSVWKRHGLLIQRHQDIRAGSPQSFVQVLTKMAIREDGKWSPGGSENSATSDKNVNVTLCRWALWTWGFDFFTSSCSTGLPW